MKFALNRVSVCAQAYALNIPLVYVLLHTLDLLVQTCLVLVSIVSAVVTVVLDFMSLHLDSMIYVLDSISNVRFYGCCFFIYVSYWFLWMMTS